MDWQGSVSLLPGARRGVLENFPPYSSPGPEAGASRRPVQNRLVPNPASYSWPLSQAAPLPTPCLSPVPAPARSPGAPSKLNLGLAKWIAGWQHAPPAVTWARPHAILCGKCALRSHLHIQGRQLGHLGKEAEPLTRWAARLWELFLPPGWGPWPVRTHDFPFKRARPDAIRERQKEKPGMARVVSWIWQMNLGLPEQHTQEVWSEEAASSEEDRSSHWVGRAVPPATPLHDGPCRLRGPWPGLAWSPRLQEPQAFPLSFPSGPVCPHGQSPLQYPVLCFGETSL